MMLPERCCIMMGAACFMPSMTERTSSAMAWSKPSTGTEAMLPVGAGPPALLKSASSLPNALVVSPITRFQSSSSVASACTKRPLLPELGGQRLALRLAAAGEDDLGAFLHEQLGRARADAAGGSRDDRNLAVEHAHRALPLVICSAGTHTSACSACD